MEYKLPCGRTTFLDDEDVHLLEGASSVCRKGKYVAVYRGEPKGTYLHLLIKPPSTGLEIDHIDTDPLNNRRENLREVTKGFQNQNRNAWGMYPKGISFDVHKRLFRARIQVGGKRISLGRYKSIDAAVAAYNKAALLYYGEDAMPSARGT